MKKEMLNLAAVASLRPPFTTLSRYRSRLLKNSVSPRMALYTNTSFRVSCKRNLYSDQYRLGKSILRHLPTFANFLSVSRGRCLGYIIIIELFVSTRLQTKSVQCALRPIQKDKGILFPSLVYNPQA